MKHLKKVSILLMACLIYFTSCQKNAIRQAKPTSDNNQNIKVEDGYLVFKNWKDFKAQLNRLLQSDIYSNSWDKQVGFTSANDILNDVGNKLQSCTSKEEALKVLNKYENIVSFGKDSTLQLTNISDIYSYIVNKDGLVKIGSDIYKFTKDKEYVVLNANKSKIALLKQSKKTNLKDGIVVFDFKSSNKYNRTPDHWGTPYPIDTMSHTSTRRAYYKLEYNFAGQIVRDPNTYEVIGFYVGTSAILHFYGTKHNFLGWRKYKTTFHVQSLYYDINCLQTGDNSIMFLGPYITDEVKDYYYNCLTSTVYVDANDYYAGNYTVPTLDINVSFDVYSRGVTQLISADYF